MANKEATVVESGVDVVVAETENEAVEIVHSKSKKKKSKAKGKASEPSINLELIVENWVSSLQADLALHAQGLGTTGGSGSVDNGEKNAEFDSGETEIIHDDKLRATAESIVTPLVYLHELIFANCNAAAKERYLKSIFDTLSQLHAVSSVIDAKHPGLKSSSSEDSNGVPIDAGDNTDKHQQSDAHAIVVPVLLDRPYFLQEVDVQTFRGRTSLHIAASIPSIVLVQTLLDHGAATNIREDESGLFADEVLVAAVTRNQTALHEPCPQKEWEPLVTRMREERIADQRAAEKKAKLKAAKLKKMAAKAAKAFKEAEEDARDKQKQQSAAGTEIIATADSSAISQQTTTDIMSLELLVGCAVKVLSQQLQHNNNRLVDSALVSAADSLASAAATIDLKDNEQSNNDHRGDSSDIHTMAATGTAVTLLPSALVDSNVVMEFSSTGESAETISEKQYMDDVHRDDDYGFSTAIWELEITREARLQWQMLEYTDRRLVAAKLRLLAHGRWANQVRPTQHTMELRLFRTNFSKGGRIIWERAITYSAVLSCYCEVIRVWGIVADHDKQSMTIQKIQDSHRKGKTCNVKKTMIPRDWKNSSNSNNSDLRDLDGSQLVYPKLFDEESAKKDASSAQLLKDKAAGTAVDGASTGNDVVATAEFCWYPPAVPSPDSYVLLKVRYLALVYKLRLVS
jgi:hypothetical protein